MQEENLRFRHERKHRITPAEAYALRRRLRVLARPDPHAGPEGGYRIRSLYFDTPDDRALREKREGVSQRQKFRIRVYNEDWSRIRLECKRKLGELSRKDQCPLCREQLNALLAGDDTALEHSGEALMEELLRALRQELLRPRSVVDYWREPFVYPAGNVRITLDSDVRGSLCLAGTPDFFHPVWLPTELAAQGLVILEVKYDAFLPEFLREAVQLDHRQLSAYSKYAACRYFG